MVAWIKLRHCNGVGFLGSAIFFTIFVVIIVFLSREKIAFCRDLVKLFNVFSQ